MESPFLSLQILKPQRKISVHPGAGESNAYTILHVTTAKALLVFTLPE